MKKLILSTFIALASCAMPAAANTPFCDFSSNFAVEIHVAKTNGWTIEDVILSQNKKMKGNSEALVVLKAHLIKIVFNLDEMGDPVSQIIQRELLRTTIYNACVRRMGQA